MALEDPVLPYGIRDIKLYPYLIGGGLGSPVDLPVSQTLSFSEAEEYEELRGDDQLVAVHGKGPTVEFDLEAGGISLDAWAVLAGGTVGETGTTPNGVKTFTKKTTQQRPYFKIEGQSVSDGFGDVHVIIYKAKISGNIEGEFSDGGFFVTKCSGQGMADDSDNLYSIIWNESETAIADAGVNEIQLIISNGTGGTFDLTFEGQTAAAIDWDASVAVMTAALEGLSNIAPGEVSVTGAPGAWYVEFLGSLGAANRTQMTVDNTSLTGGDAAVTTVRAGSAP